MGITKDKYGFMWFATWDGLNKYDGYKITSYFKDQNDTNSLTTNRFRQIFKDKQGDIWVLGMDSIIIKYNYETDNFTKCKILDVPKYIQDSLNRNIAIFHTYIKTPDYIWKVYQFNNKLARGLKTSEINYQMTQINCKTGEKYVYKSVLNKKWSINDDYLRTIYLDDQNIFWVGTYTGGVNKADLLQKPFTSQELLLKVKHALAEN